MKYDPTNIEAMGPQITARPGSKRRIQQDQARATFFAIRAANAEAALQRLLDTSATKRKP